MGGGALEGEGEGSAGLVHQLGTLCSVPLEGSLPSSPAFPWTLFYFPSFSFPSGLGLGAARKREATRSEMPALL